MVHGVGPHGRLIMPPPTNSAEASSTSSIHASGHEASYWTRTACVQLHFPHGTEKKYFLKVATGDRGRDMMEGEFESMKVLNAVTPNLTPKPIAWGTFESNRDLHFFLCDFHEMDDDLPEVDKFSAGLAQMHWDSVSPTGKFGFHCNAIQRKYSSRRSLD